MFRGCGSNSDILNLLQADSLKRVRDMVPQDNGNWGIQFLVGQKGCFTLKSVIGGLLPEFTIFWKNRFISWIRSIYVAYFLWIAPLPVITDQTFLVQK